MRKTITIKKGETLWEIGRNHNIHWETIWNDDANQELRTKRKLPEQVKPGDSLTIPDVEGIEANALLPGKKTVCTVSRPQSSIEIPRFDCHCHAHAKSIYRMWAIGCITPSEAQKALVCNAEVDNFQMVSNPGGRHGRVAAVPLLMDMAYGPLWNSPQLDSTINANMIALFSSSVGRTTKRVDEPTDWDPWNIYPTGSYYACEDDFTRWRDAIVAVHRANPGYCFPFVPFDPRRPDALARVKDCIVNFGFVGIKLYTRQGWRLTGNVELVGDKQTGQELDRRVAEMLYWAEQNDVPILNHCSPGGWPKDEHIAFPKGECFQQVIFSESKLRDFQSSWFAGALQIAMDKGADLSDLPHPIDASGSMRLGVIAYLKKRQKINFKSCKSLAKNSLDNRRIRPAHSMSDEQRSEWINLSATYANDFAGALVDYKRLTVAPEPKLRKRYPQLRFCLAHAGSESILRTHIPDSAQEAKEYCLQHPTDGWLDQNVFNKWLDCDTNAYVDISNFSGIRDHAQRVEIFVELLKWFKNINKTSQVLFGTDWPLTWLNDAIVRETWDTVREAAEKVTEWENCWEDITRINPLRFLGMERGTKNSDRLRGFLGTSVWQTTWMATHVLSNDKELICDEQTIELNATVVTLGGVPYVECSVNGQIVAEGQAEAWDYAFCKMRSSLTADNKSRLITIETSPTISLKKRASLPIGIELAILQSIRPTSLPFIDATINEELNNKEKHVSADGSEEDYGEDVVADESADDKSDDIDMVDWIHTTLDLAGCVPGIGEPADGLNSILYTIRGHYGEAAISAAAMIPVVGDAGKATRLGKKVYSNVRKLKTKLPTNGIRKLMLKMVGKSGRKAFGETKLIGRLANISFNKLPESSQQLKKLFKRHSPFEMGDEIWAQLKGQKFGQKKHYATRLNEVGWRNTDTLKKLEDVLNNGIVNQAKKGRLAIVQGDVAVIVEPLKAASKSGKSMLISIIPSRIMKIQ